MVIENRAKEMEVAKIVVTLVVTFTITITMATKITTAAGENLYLNPTVSSSATFDSNQASSEPKLMLPRRVSRFLNQEEKNPRAADHCHKDNDVCSVQGTNSTTCCNNKCVDLTTDDHNCGACKTKCKFTDVCCRGECVNIVFDKRHCGACNHRCKHGDYCFYGMCNYA